MGTRRRVRSDARSLGARGWYSDEVAPTTRRYRAAWSVIEPRQDRDVPDEPTWIGGEWTRVGGEAAGGVAPVLRIRPKRMDVCQRYPARNGVSSWPRPSTSTTTRSPSLSQTGSCMPAMTPAGVPVIITSPGRSVK